MGVNLQPPHGTSWDLVHSHLDINSLLPRTLKSPKVKIYWAIQFVKVESQYCLVQSKTRVFQTKQKLCIEFKFALVKFVTCIHIQ